MVDLSGARILVGGAGVFGSACALGLARAGAKIILADPAPLAANASGLAAGMLAPAFESALDPAATGLFPFRAARDLWPAFAEDLPRVQIDRAGALFHGDDAEVEAVLAKLNQVSAAVERRGQGLFTPEDWRIEPKAALGAMQARLEALGGRRVYDPVQSFAGEVDATVLCCGFEARSLASELAALRPIKGQILRFAPRALTDGPVRRGPHGYVAPDANGALAGSSMEEGLSDRQIDADVCARLHRQALVLAPELAGLAFEASAGVRAATPDGLPLVGASARDGVYLAAGARRNGWLLAPLVAGLAVDAVAGAADNPFAAVLRPDRFSQPG